MPARLKLSGSSKTVTFHRTPAGDVEILGKPLYAGTERELLAAIERAARSGERTLIVTPNVDQVLLLRDDGRWRDAFVRSDIRIADGMPVTLLARAMGATSLKRITGADLLPRVVATSVVTGLRVAVIGGNTKSRELGIANLLRDNPGAQVRGFDIPFIEDVSDSASRVTVSELLAWAPDVTFICLGAPKQELWFCAWEDELPPGVYIGAGAAIDFAAGSVSRAPLWAQRLSMEWLWRLAQEPRRLARRYLVRGPVFLSVVVRSIASRR